MIALLAITARLFTPAFSRFSCAFVQLAARDGGGVSGFASEFVSGLPCPEGRGVLICLFLAALCFASGLTVALAGTGGRCKDQTNQASENCKTTHSSTRGVVRAGIE